jgi:hypothetical protein
MQPGMMAGMPPWPNGGGQGHPQMQPGMMAGMPPWPHGAGPGPPQMQPGMMAGMPPDPAAQLGVLKQQLKAQIDAIADQQRAAEAGTKPPTVEATDRAIERLEAAIKELREHRAQLERRPGGHRG